TSKFLLQHFRDSGTLSVRMQGEVVISAALVVLAIAISAALVAICIVVGSAFVSITVALTGREPRMFRIRKRMPSREPEPEPARREPEKASDLATEIMSDAAEGVTVYDREMRCQVWNHFMENLSGLRAEHVLGRRAGDFFPTLAEQPIEDIIARVLK